ncbi:claudin-18-like [Acipenser oxyrinchus oxyrinchus]|uniref:Claudin-18-like n=1 Tax=Acipenser oxyrinchus oxyrinchus TaxID=40147 RepID=A0AAD8FZ82_ACIOX|nr:claudin-18-like [Acipenser oxyrinchus oxyrinchus]
MAATMCQVMGFVLGLLGIAGVIASTVMDQWSTQDLYDNPVTSVYNYRGLWRSCVRQSSGFTECRPYFTILGLPGSFQAVRALMIVGIVLGVIGALISIFALKCIRMGNMEDAMKANMTLTSGILFIVGGVCGIAGVSVFANLIVTNFMFTTTTATMQGSLQPRYTFGPALFMGWVGGAVLVVGGIMMCVACKGMAPEKTHYNAVAYKASRPNTIYKSGDERSRRGFDDVYKKSTTHSDDGRQTQPSRFDYV